MTDQNVMTTHVGTTLHCLIYTTRSKNLKVFSLFNAKIGHHTQTIVRSTLSSMINSTTVGNNCIVTSI